MTLGAAKKMSAKPSPARERAPVGVADELDQIYEQYLPDVHRWARRLFGPEADVQDLIHDVFVVAVRRAVGFRGDGSVKTWLFRITNNLVKSRRRRARVRGALFGRYASSADVVTAAPVTPLEDLERREQIAELYAALDRLPDKYRTPLICYDLEGMTCEVIGELLDLSVGTVWVRLHRGRARLSAELEKLQPEVRR